MPRAVAIYSRLAEISDLRAAAGGAETPVRVIRNVNTPSPELQLLSNGRYHVMITTAGGGLQPLERSGGHALARRRHLRQLGHVLLSARAADGPVLVVGISTLIRAVGQLRSHLFRRARGVPPARPRLRHAHRNRRLAGGRHRAAARHHHQHHALAQDHRSHQLCGGRADLGGGRRAAPGVQQPVRADRDPARTAGHRLHAPAALARRASAVAVPPDGGARRGRWARPPTRPTACASSAAGTRWPIRRPWPRERRALSNSEGAVLDPIVAIRRQITLEAASRSRWTSSRAWRRRARAVSRWWRSTATGTWRTACSSWRGRTARCCCARSTPRRPTRSFTGGWPAP